MTQTMEDFMRVIKMERRITTCMHVKFYFGKKVYIDYYGEEIPLEYKKSFEEIKEMEDYIREVYGNEYIIDIEGIHYFSANVLESNDENRDEHLKTLNKFVNDIIPKSEYSQHAKTLYLFLFMQPHNYYNYRETVEADPNHNHHLLAELYHRMTGVQFDFDSNIYTE